LCPSARLGVAPKPNIALKPTPAGTATVGCSVLRAVSVIIDRLARPADIAHLGITDYGDTPVNTFFLTDWIARI
jgi:hypothetical protein